MPVTLRSRLPEISAAIPLRVGAVIHEHVNEMAKDAQDRANSLYQGDDNFAIEAGANDRGYGIMADWYWFFGEFGTTHQTARPFMFPAVESGKDNMVEAIRGALEKL